MFIWRGRPAVCISGGNGGTGPGSRVRVREHPKTVLIVHHVGINFHGFMVEGDVTVVLSVRRVQEASEELLGMAGSIEFSLIVKISIIFSCCGGRGR